jgi:hypothetical protein
MGLSVRLVELAGHIWITVKSFGQGYIVGLGNVCQNNDDKLGMLTFQFSLKLPFN